MRQIKHIALPLTLLMATLAYAEQPTPELQALDDALPGTLINDPTRLDWTVFGQGAASKPVKGDTIPGGKAALQVTVPKAGATLYEIGTNAPITAAIKPGTDLVVAFYARTASSSRSDGSGIIGVRFQQNSAPYPGFGDTVLSVGPSWRLLQLRTQAKMAIPLGKGTVALHFGAAAQSIEVGQVYVINTSVPIDASGN
jgi:hypothetical protein